ncbi:MAG: type II toxin-antitoxin system HicB family antitoxin [Anaerolineae bacterium]
MLAKFEVYFDGEYWCARGIGADVFTQGRTLDELMGNIREAASLHFEEVLEKGDNLHVLILSEMEVKGVPQVATG